MTLLTSTVTPLRCAIMLAGPTASGKTAAALALAERFPVEIISVDSALVYRQMDIGTAKPTPAELATVPHHLIDIRDPLEPYSAADFARDALRLMGEIVARQRYPLLVGGTMLYFKALLDGLDELPAADPQIRTALEAEAQIYGWPQMHTRLAEVDPSTAARLAPNDAQRIQRALEVYQLTGQPLSSWHRRSTAARPAHGPLLALEPTDRAWLHQRIALRFSQMLEQGLVDEVLRLRARGDLEADLPAMRCVGYRQVWEALEAHPDLAYADWPAGDRTELCQQGIYATRQLAKRQLTWLRGMPERISIACDSPDALNQIVNQAAAHIASTPLPT